MQELRDLQRQGGEIAGRLQAQHQLRRAEARLHELSAAHASAKRLQKDYKTHLGQLQRGALARRAELNATGSGVEEAEAEARQLRARAAVARQSTAGCEAALQQARWDLQEHVTAHARGIAACKAELRDLQQSCVSQVRLLARALEPCGVSALSRVQCRGSRGDR